MSKQEFLIEWNQGGKDWTPITTLTYDGGMSHKDVLGCSCDAINMTVDRIRATGEDSSLDDFRIKRVS